MWPSFSKRSPVWTNENRARYDRSGLRYQSDVTDAEWALIAALISTARRGGGRRKTGRAASRERADVCSPYLPTVVGDPQGFAAEEHGETAILIFGPMKAHSIALTTRSK